MTKQIFRGKAITMIQPWASAIAFAGKDIENRSWYSHYRGALAYSVRLATSAIGDNAQSLFTNRKRPGG